jgi:hypothetical protein
MSGKKRVLTPEYYFRAGRFFFKEPCSVAGAPDYRPPSLWQILPIPLTYTILRAYHDAPRVDKTVNDTDWNFPQESDLRGLLRPPHTNTEISERVCTREYLVLEKFSLERRPTPIQRRFYQTNHHNLELKGLEALDEFFKRYAKNTSPEAAFLLAMMRGAEMSADSLAYSAQKIIYVARETATKARP